MVEHVVDVVARDAKDAHLRAQLARLRRQADGVAVGDLRGPQRLAGCDQLVAGGEQRHAWPAVDIDLGLGRDRGVAAGRTDGQRRGTQLRTGRKQ